MIAPVIAIVLIFGALALCMLGVLTFISSLMFLSDWVAFNSCKKYSTWALGTFDDFKREYEKRQWEKENGYFGSLIVLPPHKVIDLNDGWFHETSIQFSGVHMMLNFVDYIKFRKFFKSFKSCELKSHWRN